MNNTPPRRGEQRPQPRGNSTPAPANRSAPARRASREYEAEQYSQDDQYDQTEQSVRRASRTAGQQSTRNSSGSGSHSGTSSSSSYGSGSRPRSRPEQLRYGAPRRDAFPIIMGAVVGILVVGVMIAVYLLVTRDSGTTATTTTATTTNANTTTNTTNANAADQATAAPTMAQSANASGIQTMQAIRPATGLGTPMPDEGNNHVDEGQPITYQNYPPSSGTHYGSTAEYGFHEDQVAEGKFVHSMEHGAIVLYYKPDIGEAIKQQLKDTYTKLPLGKYGKVKLAIVPYTNMTTPLAIAAWDRLLPISTYNYEEIQTFYNEWVDKGPEDVP